MGTKDDEYDYLFKGENKVARMNKNPRIKKKRFKFIVQCEKSTLTQYFALWQVPTGERERLPTAV